MPRAYGRFSAGDPMAGATTSPMASSSPFRWRWPRCPSAWRSAFSSRSAKQSEGAVAAARRQHLHHDLPRPARTADAVPGLLTARQIGSSSSCSLFSPDATIEVNSFVAGMIALGVVFSSYASEVFLSAFRAIPHGQYEGGYAIGLSNGQTMRLVILPQLIRIALPGLANLLADPAQGHRAGLGRSASPTSCARPASPRASPSMPSCSSASPP